MKAGFSLIVCTYNPDERTLQRALTALLQLDAAATDHEVIIVDNNSSPAISERAVIKNLPPNSFKFIREPKPGLANARICGVANAGYDTIVFVDDDNELGNDYLQGLQRSMKEHPEVGVWGPAKILVDFIDDTPAWIRKYMQGMYQQKDSKELKYGCEEGWPVYYPVGSGLVVRKEILNLYINEYRKGALTATDRIGNSLASGGDSQIIWTAVKAGIPVGTTPLLKLTHIIPGKRTTLKYLVDLTFNISYSFYSCQYEMFGNKALFNLKPGLLNGVRLFITALNRTKLNIADAYKVYLVDHAWYKGYGKFYQAFYNK